MANWGLTDLAASLWEDLLEILKGRDVDAATAFAQVPTNPIPQSIRWNRTTKEWQEFDGSGNWVPQTLAISSGGTGAVDAAGARASLGIGTMGVQSSNAVAVTGGALSGVTGLQMAGHITFLADAQYNIGSLTVGANRVYIHGALVAPVGANKYATNP